MCRPQKTIHNNLSYDETDSFVFTEWRILNTDFVQILHQKSVNKQACLRYIAGITVLFDFDNLTDVWSLATFTIFHVGM